MSDICQAHGSLNMWKCYTGTVTETLGMKPVTL